MAIPTSAVHLRAARCRLAFLAHLALQAQLPHKQLTHKRRQVVPAAREDPRAPPREPAAREQHGVRLMPFRTSTVVFQIAALSAVAPLPNCATEATGVDACRRIESARCEAASKCGFSSSDVDRCLDFYRDQCLRGIENADHVPQENETRECINAVQATATCAEAKKPTMHDCTAAVVADASEADLTPCQILLDQVHQLRSCAFVAAPANPSSSTTQATGSGGAGGALNPVGGGASPNAG